MALVLLFGLLALVPAWFGSPVLALRQPDWTVYSTVEALHTRVASIVGRNRGSMASAWARDPKAASDEQSDIMLVTVGVNAAPTDDPTKRIGSLEVAATPAGTMLRSLLSVGSSSLTRPPPIKGLLNFGEHGREVISSEIALRLLQFLDLASIESFDSGTTKGGDAVGSQSKPVVSSLFLAWLLSHVSLQITPLLGVWSHRRVEQGFVCERKNKNGVDPNRNWDYLWSGETDGGSGPAERLRQARLKNVRDDQYPGPAPFSEVESRTLQAIASTFRPDLYINYHSGIREMYCGWDHRAELVPNHREVQRLLASMNRRCQCPMGGAGAIGGYVVYGGSMDYLYDTLQVPYSLTVEVFGGPAPGVGPSDCFAYFNPTTPEALEATTRDWALITIEALMHLIAEKQGQSFPFQLDVGLREEELPEMAGDPMTPKNYYTRIEEIHRRWTDPRSGFRVAFGGKGPVDPFLAPGLSERLPSWNDACTPFFEGLSPQLVEDLTRPQRLEQVLCVYELEPETKTATPHATTPLVVLVLGGATWNDLLSSDLVCTWMAAHQTVGSSAPGVRFFFVPTLQGLGRVAILEAPLVHDSFCSESLGPDQRQRLLAHQLYSTQALLRLLRDELKPDIVIEVAAEEMESPSQTASDQQQQQREFLHLEATWLRNPPTHVGQAQDALERVTLFITSTSSGGNIVGASSRTLTEARTRRDAHAAQPHQCAVGHIDVEGLLLDAPVYCPTCSIFLKVYAHGRDSAGPRPSASTTAAPSADAAAAATQAAYTQGASVETVEELMRAATHSAWLERGQNDRAHPSSYVSMPPTTVSAPPSPAPSSATVTAIPSRTIAMWFSRSDLTRSGRSSSGTLCDFLWRNIASHATPPLLAHHLSASSVVWASIVVAFRTHADALHEAIAAAAPHAAQPLEPFVRIGPHERVTPPSPTTSLSRPSFITVTSIDSTLLAQEQVIGLLLFVLIACGAYQARRLRRRAAALLSQQQDEEEMRGMIATRA